jgi:Xaa-Pro aminopeptidase
VDAITPLMNRDRAEAVMAHFGVSALVLGDPVNIYHATGVWPLTLTMGHLGSTIAIVPQDRAAPPILVTAQFLHYFLDLGSAPFPVQLYTGPGDGAEAAPPFFFAHAEGGATDVFEDAARKATHRQLDAIPPAASPLAALHAVLPNGLVAVDGPVAEHMLPAGRCSISAEPLLRRIRMVKSAAEIVLMRRAAKGNAEAARAAVASVRPGDSYEDLRRAFFADSGRRGGIASFLAIDSVSAEHRDGIIREGRAFQIDAVAHYDRYHGDFGRTVFVGEVDPLLAKAVEAAQRANEAVAAVLRPGLLYSDVMRIGQEAIRAAGVDAPVPSAPHSVGLWHTDEAFEGDSLTFAKADHRIEKDMVLSVDLPVLLTDIGGTVHLEDLWLITEDGCEALNETGDAALRVGVA